MAIVWITWLRYPNTLLYSIQLDNFVVALSWKYLQKNCVTEHICVKSTSIALNESFILTVLGLSVDLLKKTTEMLKLKKCENIKDWKITTVEWQWLSTYKQHTYEMDLPWKRI